MNNSVIPHCMATLRKHGAEHWGAKDLLKVCVRVLVLVTKASSFFTAVRRSLQKAVWNRRNTCITGQPRKIKEGNIAGQVK